MECHYWPPDQAHIIDDWFHKQPDLRLPRPDERNKMMLDQLSEQCITFGKHKGKRFDQIPRNYLEWLCTSRMTRRLKDEARMYLILSK